jgi:alpha-mannosidase/mannosylglycerate hydrolase
MQINPRRAHYVFSSHWDREWYLTFQNFRYHLVQLFDQVLEAIAKGDLLGPFVTDGQAILLEDYLEVRPEKREIIRQFLRQGKLVAGPWYVMPDEFIVSGEALIRNLELGRQLVRTLGGKPSNAGFVCDVFGHNSQLPQIFNGFGIKFAYIWRGSNVIDWRNFRWRGADGTEIICYRFGPAGYCDYAMKIRHVTDRKHPFDPEKTIEEINAYLSKEAAMTEVDPILIFDGGDHLHWDIDTYSIITKEELALDPPIEIIHSSLDDYQAEVLSQVDRITPRVEGELREPGFFPGTQDQQDVIPGVLSSRVWIKQMNAQCQTALCHWAEPLCALATSLFSDQKEERGFVDIAWKWLLQNHPHDSICGCSIDAVHEDMRYRFAQSLQIADSLTENMMLRVSASVADNLEKDDLRITLFNPLPFSLNQTIELTVDIPTEWPKYNDWFSPELKPVFRLFGPEGQEIEYQLLSQEPDRTKFYLSDNFMPEVRNVNPVSISLPVSIPATGYTSLIARADKKSESVRFSTKSSLKVTDHSIANDLLQVEIEPNGSFTLVDLRTGHTYRQLMCFEDGADIGNGYNYRSPVSDQVYCSTASQSSIALIRKGPYIASLLVRTSIKIPDEFDFKLMKRSSQWIDLTIESVISLRPGANFVEIENIIYNRSKDHRLRVLFPSDASSASTYLTDTPFDIVNRPISIPENFHLYREPDPLTRPQQSWVSVYDDQCGLAVIAPGLMEVMVKDVPERSIALTLFRSTRNTVFTDGEPGGQLLGPLHFKYDLLPILGVPDRASLFQLGQRLSTGLRAVQITKNDLKHYRGNRKLPLSMEFLKIDGNVVVTSIRQTNPGLEVRLFNPNIERAKATIKLLKDNPEFATIENAELVDFEHQPISESLGLRDGTLSLSVEPKKILTIRFLNNQIAKTNDQR